MSQITITTGNGEVIEVIDASEYNLNKTFARSFLASEILEAIERANRIENNETRQ